MNVRLGLSFDLEVENETLRMERFRRIETGGHIDPPPYRIPQTGIDK
ncbi:MAG: hypothetical protein IIZ64_04595 [Erysipelotrichaceae bacterium]|nr:hypothetical protein [Erysipelotrichaceae bacterium]